jgi:hypothetical protein
VHAFKHVANTTIGQFIEASLKFKTHLLMKFPDIDFPENIRLWSESLSTKLVNVDFE